MKTRDYFIQTDGLGDGVNLTVNKKWELSINDMYINPNTNILIIFYLSPKQEMIHSTTSCENFGDITITEIRND